MENFPSKPVGIIHYAFSGGWVGKKSFPSGGEVGS